ncbi:MAG: hypothetical protein OHK0013_08330 [Sandaracinaceae bacterium]
MTVPAGRDLSSEERAALVACTACGACDAQLRPDDGWDRALAGPPSRWTKRLAEAPESWSRLRAAIAHLPTERARDMEERCHARVPFEALRVEAHAHRPKAGPKKKRIHDPG